MRNCWCGNSNLIPFGPENGECRTCGTLVYLKETLSKQSMVSNDETDLYGKKYWLDHQQEAFGYPDIYTRARNDLTERNLHWLKAMLKYCIPPAEVLEIGCAHGSFVALLQLAGYNASGVEMSPWVVEFGKKTFDVPISIGPIETLEITPNSLDVIALMDVLEHLPDPVSTMKCCLKLLKPNGLLLIQTPQFKVGMNYTTLKETKDRFLEMLIPEEHIYLFSDRSVRRLFKQVFAENIQFEPAIFGHYDMFLAVSRMPLQTNTPEQVDSAVMATSNGRFALALLDLRERELDLTRGLNNLESDLAARGEQIESLTSMLRESESDRAARGEQIESLTSMLRESESDRAARGEQIESLTNMLQESESMRTMQGEFIKRITSILQALFTRKGFTFFSRILNWSELFDLQKEIRRSMNKGLKTVAVDLTPILPGGENGGQRSLPWNCCVCLPRWHQRLGSFC